jgi:hypothetical protein
VKPTSKIIKQISTVMHASLSLKAELLHIFTKYEQYFSIHSHYRETKDKRPNSYVCVSCNKLSKKKVSNSLLAWWMLFVACIRIFELHYCAISNRWIAFEKTERREHLLLKEAKIHQNHSSKLVEQKASVISIARLLRGVSVVGQLRGVICKP